MWNAEVSNLLLLDPCPEVNVLPKGIVSLLRVDKYLLLGDLFPLYIVVGVLNDFGIFSLH